MKSGILDTILLILLILAAFWGFIKGFGKGTIRSLAKYAGLGCGYFFGVPLAEWILTVDINSNPFYNLYLDVLPSSEVFQKSLNGLSTTEQSALLSEAMSEIHIPSIFQGIFTTRATVLTQDVSCALASSFTGLTICALCFVAVFLLAYLLVRCVLGKITDFTFGEDGKNFLGRLAGAIKKTVSVGGGLLVVFVLLLLINNLMLKFDNAGLNDFIVSDLHLAQGDYVSLGRIFYNTAGSFINWIQNV